MTEPVRPLEALITELLDEIQAKVQQLDVHQMTGTFDGQEFQYVLVRRAQVHEILNTARTALLQASAPPAPTAEPMEQPADSRGRLLLILNGRQCFDLGWESAAKHFLALKALADSDETLTNEPIPAAQPERVSEGKE